MKQNVFHLVLFGIATSTFFLACRKESTQSNPPIAVAGRNITVQLPHDDILLDGSSSYDPDGEIVQYKWSKIAGPDFITISGKGSSKATLEFLTAGEYKIQLMVTDNTGAVGFDTVDVTIIKYPAGHEIELNGHVFYYDRFDDELYVRTNPRPDIFFNYGGDLHKYLNAEVLFRLTSSTTWLTLKPVSDYDPATAVQYLYTISADIMFIVRYPADPELDGKPVAIKIRFN